MGTKHHKKMTSMIITEEEQEDQNNHQVTNSNIMNPEVTEANDFVYCGTVNSMFDSTIQSQRPSRRQHQQRQQQQMESLRQEEEEQQKEQEIKQQQEIPEVHSSRCDCGCVPPVPSLFEMAALRKKFFEEQKKNNNFIKY